MNKNILILPTILLLLFVPSVFALTIDAAWNDGTTEKTINIGESTRFYVAVTSDPPVNININLTDSNRNLLHNFDNIIGWPDIEFIRGYNVSQSQYLTAGTYYVNVYAHDHCCTRYATLTLHVLSSENQPPVLDPIGNKVVDEGQLLQFYITATDPDSQELTMTTEQLPDGASVTEINPNEWRFSWTPNYEQAGIYHTTFTVIDGEGASDSERIQITVNNVNRAPVIDHINDITITEGEVATITAHATDPDNDPITYSISDSRFQQNNNIFSWQTHQGDAGVYVVRVYASDGNLQDYQDVTVTVNRYIPENHAPVAIASANPREGYSPLTVHFNGEQSYDPDGDTITYYWDFGDGQHSTEMNPTHTYNTAGRYTALLTVSDGRLYDISEPIFIQVNEQMHELNVTSIECFPTVIVRHNQSCSVYVEDKQTGEPVGDAQVIIYFYDPNEYGRCITDRITGGCMSIRQMNRSGRFTVYAEAYKDGYIPDNNTQPRYTFYVINQSYRIVDLTIYNDPNFEHQDYDFFRGENLYAKFRAVDLDGNTVPEEIVSAAALVSPPGGRVNLTKMRFENGYYYYRLEPIPITHDFLGDSFVFAFVFNDGRGGEAQVGVIIRNNPPEIRNMPNIITMHENETLTINLQNYEYDVEDSGEDLTWSADIPTNNYFTGDIVGKTLHIIASNPGEEYISLTLTDLDYATDSSRVLVRILPVEHPNTPPTVVIVSPEDNSQFQEGAIITFAGRAFDAEDGPLPDSSIEWSSSIDGFLGNGRNIQHTLSVGTHVITLRGTDSQGLVGTDTITVIVVKSEPEKYPPTAIITSPENDARLLSPVVLTGYGTDTDGDNVWRLKPGQLKWYYQEQRVDRERKPMFIGTGEEVKVELEAGLYKIILIATDEDGMTDEDSIMINVVKTQGVDVEILSPADGTVFENRAIQFTGTGSYFDGIAYTPLRDDQLYWKSSIDGDLGTGRKITHLLSKGTHVITLTGIHDSGLRDIDSITITVGEKIEEDEAGLYIGGIDLMGIEAGENYRAKRDDTVRLKVFVENNGDYDLDDLELYLMIPELGIKTQSVSFDLEEGEDDTIELDFDLYDEPAGLYNAKIVIQNGDIKRAKYRDLRIVN